MDKVTCESCSKVFMAYKRHGKVAKFCSHACKGESYRLDKMGVGNGFYGGKHTVEVKNMLSKVAEGRVNVLHPRWKGDDVGYDAKHAWVARCLGKPDTCEFCGISGLNGHKINWANKSHKYIRDLKDWIRLCIPCHRKYDNDYKYSLNYKS